MMFGSMSRSANPNLREQAVKMLMDHVPVNTIAAETGMCRQTVAKIRDKMADNGYDVTPGREIADYLDIILQWDEVAYNTLKELKRWEEEKGRKPNLLWHPNGVKIT